jgi:hypothetical protein
LWIEPVNVALHDRYEHTVVEANDGIGDIALYVHVLENAVRGLRQCSISIDDCFELHFLGGDFTQAIYATHYHLEIN